MAGYHRAAAAETAAETDGRFVVWGGALFWLVALTGKALWMLVFDSLRLAGSGAVIFRE